MRQLDYISAITSIVAIVISFFTFGWTVYRDAIRKPKLRVHVSVRRIVQGRKNYGPYIDVEVLNLGPIPMKTSTIHLFKGGFLKRLLKRQELAFLMHDYTNPFSSKVGERMEIGDAQHFFVDYNRDCFLKDGYDELAIFDNFGRKHWAAKSDMQKLIDKYRKDFLQSHPAS
jgi:hypothetical protein